MNKQSIIDNLNHRPLSESLKNFLVLATKSQDQNLIQWVKFELTGYYGTEMTNDDVVPKYRDVSGYHADEFHRKLVLEREDMQFINTVPMRVGVVELEVYQENGLIMKEPDLCKIIQDNLGVKVTSFHVSASQVKNALANIKCELISRLSLLGEQRTTVVSASEDILEFKPNFYGFGLNLNALKRKWFPKRNE